MPKSHKPSKAEIKKYQALLNKHLSVLRGSAESLKDDALRASEQDSSVDHLADQGTDNYDQGFLLGLIENEEETIQLMEEALTRITGDGDYPYGACARCQDVLVADKAAKKAKKIEPWIPKERLEYIPWARYCVFHQEELERGRESA